MPNTINSANMSLPVPVVGVDPGPQYATDVNNCLTIIDAHTHAAGSGVPINPAGININSDLTFNNNNLIAARSLRLQIQPAVLALASDLGCLYEVGVDLYYNDGSGNQIRLTQSGAVAGTVGSISNLVAPASASYSAINQTFVWQSAANTPANMDNASITLRNLTANSNGLTLSPPNAMGSDYSITLPSLPGVQSFMTLDASGNMSAPWTVDNSTLAISSNQVIVKALGITAAQIANQTITQGKLALRTTGTSVAAGGYAVSTSSGAFSTNSTSYVDVTNLSVTITTTGRPVRLMLGAGGAAATIRVENSDPAFVQFLNGSTSIAEISIEENNLGGSLFMGLPPSAFQCTDFPVAGTYTYKVQVKVLQSADHIEAVNVQLEAYEL